uniref:Uncharacterized protein n=1 Tax=Trypanosoma congolense (strain IL3000) TaxID=1068625 RepID=G0URC6_TRYCI|nr:hypothetical protein, unlikely [Trypanosoma congolense IL3000]
MTATSFHPFFAYLLLSFIYLFFLFFFIWMFFLKQLQLSFPSAGSNKCIVCGASHSGAVTVWHVPCLTSSISTGGKLGRSTPTPQLGRASLVRPAPFFFFLFFFSPHYHTWRSSGALAHVLGGTTGCCVHAFSELLQRIK